MPNEEVFVSIPTMGLEGAEKIVAGGSLAMNLLNYLELNPDKLLSIYPEKHSFKAMAEREGVTITDIEQQFMRQQRDILIIVSFLFKDVLAEVARYYDLDYIEDKTVEHRIMAADLAGMDDDQIQATDVLAEVDKILNRKEDGDGIRHQ